MNLNCAKSCKLCGKYDLNLINEIFSKENSLQNNVQYKLPGKLPGLQAGSLMP
jgi:hypothetical protein